MPKEAIFISSVHKKFANERQALAAYIREDELLKLYFEENRSNLATLWCSSSGTDHDTDHVTDYDTAHVPHMIPRMIPGKSLCKIPGKSPCK